MDTLAYVRTQALSLTYSLLREKPEQEHNLLRLLVNKLVGQGDSKVLVIH
jgi:ribosome biogenesis protein MAK21